MYINTISGLEQLSFDQVNRSRPEYIRWLQSSLNNIWGLNLKVDGIMGSQTRNAIRSFQQKEGLVADGIVGPKTEAALSKATSGATAGQAAAMSTAAQKLPNKTLAQFGKNSAKLKEFHLLEIEKIAEEVAASWKTALPIRTIKVIGHTSSEGPIQYNITLGRYRALSVRQALQKALERKQKNLSYKVLVLADSKGPKDPIDTNETEEGMSQNRRVEVFLSTKALLPKKPPPPPVPPGEKDPQVAIPKKKLQCKKQEYDRWRDRCSVLFNSCNDWCNRWIALDLLDGGDRTAKCARRCTQRYGACLKDAAEETHCKRDPWKE